MEIGAQPGNDNSAKGKEWTLAIKRALARRGESDYRAGLDILADKLVNAAETDPNAYLRAIEAVGDRIEGRVSQSVAVTGEGGGPVKSEVLLRFV